MRTAGEARTKLLEIGRQLSVYDFEANTVTANSKNSDGAFFFWPDAFALTWHEWIFVFTEHYGYYEFHMDDMCVQCFHPTGAGIADFGTWKADPRSVKYWAEQGGENPAERYVTKSTPIRHSDR